uniref:Uncharacterized protein n=1 Tax=viral metagenome TaxID=1070528 RepID=A0A6M3X469_9ZZZZ
MLIVAILTSFIHVLILIRSVIFFRTVGQTRESDKTAVASISMLSILYLLAMSLAWLERPPLILSQQISGPMFIAYNLAVAILFYGQIQLVTNRRAEHACQPHS